MPRVNGFHRWGCDLSDSSALRPAVFLDRDGTISEEVGYLNHVSRFRILPRVAESIRRLNEAGLPVIVVTNQSGVGRGYFPESLVHSIHEIMAQQLEAAGARLDAIYYCPHTSVDRCDCRKPNTGMLEVAAREHAIDLQRSFVVGDRHGDIELARRVGACSILVRTGYGEGEYLWNAAKWSIQPDFVAADLADAVHWILRPTK
ncbi:MAG TPA: HAD family hydrolase [Candidatus Acidoferrum sp.]|nr:HAD family hydrolase [Candidatus Acidoferrum sp.]